MPQHSKITTFRKIVVQSLRVLSEKGFRCYVKQASEKIKRGELAIMDPLHRRTASGTGRDTAGLTQVVLSELSEENLIRRLTRFLDSEAATLEFPIHESLLVSVIVVIYNNAHYTYQCLRSLASETSVPCEIIIVDNASEDDETVRLLPKVRNAVVAENKENKHFPHGCNQGAKIARGKYLLFLNSDAFVQPNCISHLITTVESSDNIGAVGAKILWRDGRLQEAGSIIWSDGSALGYGRGDAPDKPEYCYRREVDYCSAACLMVRRDAFERVGGFDENFSPAYYEDTDLCMRLWSSGWHVVYEPNAKITHIEFASTSFESARQLMEKQKAIFVSKHSEELRKQLPFLPVNIIRARDKRTGASVLVIDDCVPKPTEGSGYPRMSLMLSSLASLGFKVTLLPVLDATATQPETDTLTSMGVEVLWGTIGISETLRQRKKAYDIIMISRPHNALLTFDLARQANPETPIIYDAEALFYKREQLRQSLGLNPIDARFKDEATELSILRSADYVIAVSKEEMDFIEQSRQQPATVFLWGHPHKAQPTSTPFSQRRDLLFVGGFKSSPAHNDDAVIYFTKNMLRPIRNIIPECRLIVAGSNPPESVKRLASDSVIVTGYVEDLRVVYETCRVFVAPIRFGAGSMWKVIEAMSNGVPCVLSSVSAQGLGIVDGHEALVAHDAEEFIEKTLQLYQDEILWRRVRQNGIIYVSEHCDPSIMQTELGEFLKKIISESHKARRKVPTIEPASKLR